jgi:hypothetical protein
MFEAYNDAHNFNVDSFVEKMSFIEEDNFFEDDFVSFLDSDTTDTNLFDED